MFITTQITTTVMTWGLGSHFNWLIHKNILTDVWVSRKMSYLLISFYYFIKCLHHLLQWHCRFSSGAENTVRAFYYIVSRPLSTKECRCSRTMNKTVIKTIWLGYLKINNWFEIRTSSQIPNSKHMRWLGAIISTGTAFSSSYSKSARNYATLFSNPHKLYIKAHSASVIEEMHREQ